jgi:hypothetical protein
VASNSEIAELTGVDLDFAVEHTGVEMDSEAQGNDDPEEQNKVDGLRQQDPSKRFDVPNAEPTTVPVVPSSPAQAALPKKGMAARNVRLRKKPEKYFPSMKGNKYAVALTQIMASLKESKDAMLMEQKSVKLMSKGVHCDADVVGMVMAQLALKAAIKKWGDKAKYAVTAEMKQPYWRNSYKPKHWRDLSKGQKEKHAILESHIFVEEKRDGKLKARKVIGGNKQREYSTKEDASSPTLSAEAVMLICVIDALEGRDNAVVDILNAFVQTVVEDGEHRVIVCFGGPLVDILGNISPHVSGQYVSSNKSGQMVLLVQFLIALYGTIVATLLSYKFFSRA